MNNATAMANGATLNSGKESAFLLWLNAGQIITSATFTSSTQALVAGTNQWFTLRNSSKQLLKVTADDTSTAWSATTSKTLTFSGGTYTVVTSGYYYVGIMVAAGTPPSLLQTTAGGSGAYAIAPAIGGRDDVNTGLTTPATAVATLGAFTSANSIPYAYVS